MGNLVIFVGAGFSSFAGLPVMSNFTDRLRASQYLKGEDQAEFDHIQLECDALGAFIGGSARNLEQLASFLSVMKLTNPAYRFPGCRQYADPDAALKLVMRCTRHLTCPELDGVLVKQETQRIFDLLKQWNITFVTTNYDLVVEFAGISHGASPSPSETILQNCIHDPDERSIYFTRSQHFQIFKLHGSVNWYQSPGESIKVHNHCDISCAPPRSPNWKTEIVRQDDSPAGDCVMVPPSVLKPAMTDPLSSQWSAASRAIADAELLWFVGYSFPETDSFMRFFLASALASNAKIRQLAIIDPNRDACRRARDLFKLPSLIDVFRAIPVSWQEVSYELLSRGDVLRAVKWQTVEYREKQRQLQSFYDV